MIPSSFKSGLGRGPRAKSRISYGVLRPALTPCPSTKGRGEIPSGANYFATMSLRFFKARIFTLTVAGFAG